MKLVAAIVLVCTSSGFAKQLDRAAKANELYEQQVPELKWPVKVHLPENYDATKRWPVLIYYHGTNGRPTLDLLHHYTKKKDFICIGMAYLKQGRFKYSEENLRKEITKCHEVLQQIGKHCNIDPTRIFVGGFSKGGWAAAMFVDQDHKFAGAFVLGGGVYDRQLYKATKFSKRTPVYIGVGQQDGNTIMSMNAKVHFRKLGAEVTLDIWQGIGHTWPLKPNYSKSFAQWLEVAKMLNQTDAHKKELSIWFERRLKEVLEVEDIKQRYIQLETLAEMPAVSLLREAAYPKIQKELQAMRALDPIKTEWEVEQRYRKIVRYEMKDRALKTLETACKGYQNLATKHPNLIYGKRAEIDYKRTKYVIDYTNKRLQEKK